MTTDDKDWAGPASEQKGPQPHIYEQRLDGLKGWLILVGIGLFLGMGRLIFELVQLYGPLLSDPNTQALITPGSESFRPALAGLIVTEMIVNGVMIGLMIWAIYLYFSKKLIFPKLYIFIAAASLVIVIADAWAAKLLIPGFEAFDAETIKSIFRSGVAAIIWIPYMLISKRVASTFRH